MLYDQALLVVAYVEAWQATGKDLYRQTALDVLSYVRREMTSRQGAFYSAQDSDSEGEEGRFYTWSAQEIRTLLAPDQYSAFSREYQVAEPGNYSFPTAGRAA
jgi:hypothetical protein